MLQLPFDTNHACFPNGLSVLVVVVVAMIGTVVLEVLIGVVVATCPIDKVTSSTAMSPV